MESVGISEFNLWKKANSGVMRDFQHFTKALGISMQPGGHWDSDYFPCIGLGCTHLGKNAFIDLHFS